MSFQKGHNLLVSQVYTAFCQSLKSGGIHENIFDKRNRYIYNLRIMYDWKKSAKEIWLFTLYSKNEKATIPSHILKKIAEEIKNE